MGASNNGSMSTGESLIGGDGASTSSFSDGKSTLRNCIDIIRVMYPLPLCKILVVGLIVFHSGFAVRHLLFRSITEVVNVSYGNKGILNSSHKISTQKVSSTLNNYHLGIWIAFD